MSKDLINIGIIGSGYISNFHIDVIKSIKNVNICGIYSRTLKNAKNKSLKYNIGYYTNNFKNFLKKYDYDGILVLVSADKIYSITSKLLKLRIPILIEKPVGLSIDELNKLIKINKKYNTPNLIGLNRRYYSTFQKVHSSLIGKNKLRSFLIEGHENFWNIKKMVMTKKIIKKWHFANSIHSVDLINFFANSKLQKSTHFNNKIGSYNNITSIFKFKNGVNGTYVSNWNSPERYSIKLFTDQNTYIFKPLENCFVVNKKFKTKQMNLNTFDMKFKPGFYLQFQNFIKLIKSGKNSWPDVNLKNILVTYRIIDKIHNSI